MQLRKSQRHYRCEWSTGLESIIQTKATTYSMEDEEQSEDYSDTGILLEYKDDSIFRKKQNKFLLKLEDTVGAQVKLCYCIFVRLMIVILFRLLRKRSTMLEKHLKNIMDFQQEEVGRLHIIIHLFCFIFYIYLTHFIFIFLASIIHIYYYLFF